ncbi:MAG: hypothetical protein R2791_01525 [Saprospiraceae bacterium]
MKSNPQLKELASVPLLLTLLCITYDEYNDFPTNRAELYMMPLMPLLRKWIGLVAFAAMILTSNSDAKKENMFARIAFGTLWRTVNFIREEDLKK